MTAPLPQLIYAQTAHGELEVQTRGAELPRELAAVFRVIDGKSTFSDFLAQLEIRSAHLQQTLDTLIRRGYVEVIEDAKRAQTPLTPASTSDNDLAHQLTARVQSARREQDETKRHAGASGREAQDSNSFPELLIPHAEATGPTSNSPIPPKTVAPTSPPTPAPEAIGQGERVKTLTMEVRPLHERLHADRAAHDVLVETVQARRNPEPAQLSRTRAPTTHPQGDAAPRKALTPQQARNRVHARRARRIAIAALPVLLIAWMQFAHLNSYIPSAQRALSIHFGHPTSVTAVRYVLLPTPRVVLEGVTIGEQFGIKVGRIDAHAWPTDFLGGWLSFSTVEARGVTIHPAMLAAIPSWSAARHPDGIHLDQLKLTHVKLGVPSSRGPGLDGEVRFSSNGALKRASLRDEGMELEIIPQATGLRVKLKARDWQPPLSWPLTLNELTLEGIADTQHFASTVLNARTGGGMLTGHLSARWEGPLKIAGQFELKDARLDEILPRDLPALNMKGVLDLNASYAMHADAKTGILRPLQIDATFGATRGELMNADLLRAVQSAGSPTAGGRTPFHTLKGAVSLSGATYSYRDVQLSSGLLDASGNFEVAPDGRLNGRIITEVRARGAVLRTPLNLSGTVQGSRLSR